MKIVQFQIIERPPCEGDDTYSQHVYVLTDTGDIFWREGDDDKEEWFKQWPSITLNNVD